VDKIFQNKIFQFITGFIRVIFTIIIVMYLLFILAQRVTGNKSIFGYRLFTVATGSMAGVYEINDVIAVKDWDAHTLKVGDDIAYQGARGGLEGMLITHRIIRIENAENGDLIIVTQGVNAPAEDPSITESQVLGKVVGVVPVISLLNHIVKSQVGFFLLIFCPLVLIIVLEVLQTITDIRLEKHEIQEIRNREEEAEVKEVMKEPVVEQKVSEETKKNDDIELL
jgi:signal peptidase I